MELFHGIRILIIISCTKVLIPADSYQLDKFHLEKDGQCLIDPWVNKNDSLVSQMVTELTTNGHPQLFSPSPRCSLKIQLTPSLVTGKPLNLLYLERATRKEIERETNCISTNAKLVIGNIVDSGNPSTLLTVRDFPHPPSQILAQGNSVSKDSVHLQLELTVSNKKEEFLLPEMITKSRISQYQQATTMASKDHTKYQFHNLDLPTTMKQIL